MKQHPHVATPYEIKAAAEQRLKVIVLPVDQDVLQPGILLKYDPKDGISQETTIDPGFWNKIPYREGDHLYLQERWYDVVRGGEIIDYLLESNNPDWEPLFFANTMPMEAAEHWFTIADGKVIQMSDISIENTVLSGLSNIPVTETNRGDAIARLEQCKTNWNAAYPEQPWNRDRHVIFLRVKAFAP